MVLRGGVARGKSTMLPDARYYRLKHAIAFQPLMTSQR